MTNITIGRYDNAKIIEADGSTKPLATEWAGWIEGTREDGTSWITFLDASGAPALHWANRNSSNGGVVGEPISLA